MYNNTFNFGKFLWRNQPQSNGVQVILRFPGVAKVTVTLPYDKVLMLMTNNIDGKFQFFSKLSSTKRTEISTTMPS